MPLKKKEEVCGKPTQYNVQTREYDWKCLPDTHFNLNVMPRGRRYAAAPVIPGLRERENGIPMKPLRSPPKDFKEIQVTPSRDISPPLLTPKESFAHPLPPLAPAPIREVHVPLSLPVIPWSHEDIRQRAQANEFEANKRYLCF